MIQQLQNYFLNPQNLIAAASILILLIFYLLKPKPEKKMMPSVMFFREEENPGKLKQGVRKLLNNKFLILHLLISTLLVAALADPFTRSMQESNEVTVLLDATANTADNFEQYRRYAEQSLSKKNNIVVVGEEVRTYTDLQHSTALQIIRDTVSTEIKRNLQTAVAAARSLEGNLYMATNMASMEQNQAERAIDSISGQKYIDVMNKDFSNSHGIKDYKITDGTATVYVKNYKEKKSEIMISANGDTRSIEIDSSGLKPVKIQLQKGRNNITLEKDQYGIDNTLYLYRPESESIDVQISGRLPYFREAVKSIPEASISSDEPDIKAVSGSLINQIDRSEIVDGQDIIYFSETGFNQPGYLPVSNLREASGDVQVNKFIETTVFGSRYLKGELSQDAENYTKPASTIVKRNIGDGTVVQYNLQGIKFERQLIYPIFWRNIFKDIENIRTTSSSNMETGAPLLETPIEQGYIQYGGKEYGISTTGVFTPVNLQPESEEKIGYKKQSVSQVLASVVFILLILETVLLYRERVV